MNLDELTTFLEVIETGSLAGAAQRTHVTPSTVTARLNTLEAQLGCRLLHRNKSGAELTAAGFKLQRYAELMTQLWRQAQYEVALPPGIAGVCNVGLEYSLWRDVGSGLLDAVRVQAPRFAVALWPGEDSQLRRWLDIGLIDVAFCYSAEAGDAYASRLLFEDVFELVATAREAGATLDESYVYVDHGGEFRRQHAEAFVDAPPARVTIAASEWALEYVLTHRAKGYLPRRMTAPLVASGRLHIVPQAPTFVRPVYAVENVRAVSRWDWYESVIGSVRPSEPSQVPRSGARTRSRDPR